MTEVPEHLLKRSRERREALGLATPAAPGDAPAAEPSAAVEPAGETAPVPAAAASPAVPAEPAPPPPPKPVPPHIQAAYSRKRIPWWAMPVVAALPLWLFIFSLTLEPPSRGAEDPLTLGEQLYNASACAACHGAGGEGGTGFAFTNGDVLLTFPDPADHIAWIRDGADSADPDGGYGDPTRPGGRRNVADLDGTMPGHPNLTDEELALIARYEREVLGGAEPEPELVALTEGEAEGGGAEGEGESPAGG